MGTRRRGQKQHRHDAAGSVIKINQYVAEPPAAPPSGYRELIVTREDRAASLRLTDPGGNRVCLVPLGHQGINQIRLSVRNLETHRRFYAEALGLVEEARTGCAAFRAGVARSTPGDTQRDEGASPSKSSKLTEFMREHLQPVPGPRTQGARRLREYHDP
ncbi:MAG: hypothetical protein QOG67_2308 [Verrucomicrobiota bacterium]